MTRTRQHLDTSNAHAATVTATGATRPRLVTPPFVRDPWLGRHIDGYRLERQIGQGGMGVVYLAEHVCLGERIAIKILDAPLAARRHLAARFELEAKVAGRLRHRNVVAFRNSGLLPEGARYLAMEYLEGLDLEDEVVAKGPMDWPRVRDLLLQLGSALEAAHALGIVHRDLKPSNVRLVHEGGPLDLVKVLDFGVAKELGGPALTIPGEAIGTIEYMAPEQIEGRRVDARADLYALGALVYFLLTGQPPLRATSLLEIARRHREERVVPPSVRRPQLHLPAEVDALVLRALERDPERRWQSARDMRDAALQLPGRRPSDGRVLAAAR